MFKLKLETFVAVNAFVDDLEDTISTYSELEKPAAVNI